MFDIHAPMKKRYIRANQGPFMNKTLKKERWHALGYVTNFWIIKLSLTKLHIKIKEITVSSLFRKEKKSFFENLDTKNITDNKSFCKPVKSF